MRPPGSMPLLRSWALLSLAALAASVAHAFDVRVSNNDGLLQSCSGMWAGKNTSMTLSFFPSQSDAKVAVVMYEWADFRRLGLRKASDLQLSNGQYVGHYEYICSADAVARGLCASNQLGNWIAPDDGTFARHIVQVSPQHTSEPIRYEVKKTGYWCTGAVAVSQADGDPALGSANSSAVFSGVVHFENRFKGTMPAAEYPKVGFYFWLTVVYILLAAGWGYQCFVYRAELLPIQHMISGIMAFLIVNEAVQWGYMHYQNTHSIDYWHMRALFPNHGGETVGLRALLAATALLDAAKTTLSLFLLLVVSLGYGVVRPSLGPVMRRVQALGIAHFVCGMLYTVGIIMLLTESSTIWPILFIMPLAMTLAIFLIWILHALTTTIATLERRRQSYKQQVFTNLHRLLTAVAVSIMLFFVATGLLFGQAGSEFGAGTWKYRWFMLDGWLSILYLLAFAGIAYLWRPTGQNLRLSMSDEVATDDNGQTEDYEINEFAQPDEPGEDDDEPQSQPKSGFLGSIFNAVHRAAEQQSGASNPPPRTAPSNPEPATSTPAPATTSPPSRPSQDEAPRESEPAVLHDSGDAFTIGEGEDEEADPTPKTQRKLDDDSATLHFAESRDYQDGTAAERKGLFNSSDDEDDDSFSDIGKDVNHGDSKKKSD